MPFREILRQVVSDVDGAAGAVLMGNDGISIDEYIKDGHTEDIQLLAVEYSTIIKEIRRAVDVLKTGKLDELSLATAQSRIIIRIVSEDIFVLMVLSPDGNFGKARYLLKRSVPHFRDAL